MSEESAASPKFIKFCQRTEFSPQKGELGALESKESFSFHGEKVKFYQIQHQDARAVSPSQEDSHKHGKNEGIYIIISRVLQEIDFNKS